ncbi:hypothetical protein [uncultured Rhodoblastus sp.]|uniref:hypothetical protein n=1 Tax=uncultured Rhodoblastus sp. TaxID=543037 RepID=UPI0025DC7CB4|nr:hypothetical protein [uncultured Rhodoblastus sp.]
MINAIAKTLRKVSTRAIDPIKCFAFSIGPVVFTVINEVLPGHASFSQRAPKANVSFLALMEAPGKVDDCPLRVKTGRWC